MTEGGWGYWLERKRKSESWSEEGKLRSRGFKGQLGGNVGKLRQLKFTLIGPLVTFQLVYSKFKFTDVCRQLH